MGELPGAYSGASNGIQTATPLVPKNQAFIVPWAKHSVFCKGATQLQVFEAQRRFRSALPLDLRWLAASGWLLEFVHGGR